MFNLILILLLLPSICFATSVSVQNGFNVNGNFGIGQSNPVAPLDVQGTVRATNLTVTSLSTGCLTNTSGVVTSTGSACGSGGGGGSTTPGGAQGDIQFFDVQGTVNTFQGNNGLFYSGTGSTPGNVGIGSTNPGQELDIQGSLRVSSVINVKGVQFTGVTGTGSLVGNNNPALSGTTTTIPTIRGGTNVNSGVTLYSTSANGTTDFIKFTLGNNQGTEGMRLQDNNGIVNIGIGSSAPGTQLDVSGTIRTVNFNLSSAATGCLQSTSGLVTSTGSSCGGGSGSGTVNSGTLNQFAFYSATGTAVNGTANLIQDNNGNIGINSSLPGSKLDVQGSLRVLGSQAVISVGPNASLIPTQLNLFASAATATIENSSGGSAANLLIVGGTAGGSFLDLKSTSNGSPSGDVVEITVNGSSNNAIFGDTNTNFANVNVGIGSTLAGQKLDVNGTVRVLGTGSYTQTGTSSNWFTGNVGIGSTSPGQLLDVQGTLRMTGIGHISSSTPPPTVANNACGSTTQGTIVAKSTDIAGTVTVGTLTVTSCAITFNKVWNSAPVCVANDDTNVLAIRPQETTTGITFTSLSSASGDNISYLCIGNE